MGDSDEDRLAQGTTASAHVAINGRAAVRFEIGGVERYARELGMRLLALRPDRYRLFAPPPALAHRAGHVWEQGVLPFASRGCSLIYSPANLAPVIARRNVVVIHDIAALSHPDAYSAAYAAYQRRMLPLIARHARLLVTVSAFSRQEIAERLDVPLGRIHVIPGGVDCRFSPSADPERAARVLAITRPYVLAVGTPSARKNHGALVPVANALRGRGVDVLLAGSNRDYLRGEEPGVRRVGYVPDDLLPGLYAGAQAVVVPSRHEGFGLPCLEAMACGTPVVAAAAGALPETCGDAASLADPDDPAALLAATLRVLDDESERSRLIGAGSRRAAGYSWERSAQATDALLTELLRG